MFQSFYSLDKSMDQFYTTNYSEYIRPENYTVEAQVSH